VAVVDEEGEADKSEKGTQVSEINWFQGWKKFKRDKNNASRKNQQIQI